MKACHEIRFSNGGHMFACSLGSGQINSGENPQNMQCKGHVNRVRSIDWLENDTGFISCANDGNGYCCYMVKPRSNSAARREANWKSSPAVAYSRRALDNSGGGGCNSGGGFSSPPLLHPSENPPPLLHPPPPSAAPTARITRVRIAHRLQLPPHAAAV